MTLSAFASTIRLGHLSGDRWLLTLPLHHIGDLMVLVRSALIGTTVRLESGGTDALAEQLHSGDVTLVSLVPAQLQGLLAEGSSPFAPSVRAVLVGGAPMPPAVLAQAQALGVPVALSWGMTETSSQVATQHPGANSTLAAPPLAFARIAADEGGRLHAYGQQARGHVETRDLGRVDEVGVPVTGRVVFGNSASVLAGDHLLIHALQLVEGVGYRRLLSSMLETIGEMVTAEAVQLEQRQSR